MKTVKKITLKEASELVGRTDQRTLRNKIAALRANKSDNTEDQDRYLAAASLVIEQGV